MLKKILRQAGVLLGLAVAAGAVVYGVHPQAPALYLESEPLARGETTLAAIQENWGGDVFWIDARPRDEYEAARLPGAFLLNEHEWESQIFEHYEMFIENDLPIVVYCGTHACQESHTIAQRLRQQVGLSEVYVLRGGWREAQKLLLP
ncbi:hypothetical protein BH23VER1_BH23VER1_34530 [soil metagenome]